MGVVVLHKEVVDVELEIIGHCCDIDQKEESGSRKREVHEVAKLKINEDKQDGVEVQRGSKSTSLMSSL